MTLIERVVERDAAFFDVMKNSRRGENHLGEGRKIEPHVGRQFDRLRLDLGRADETNGTRPVGSDEAQYRTGNARVVDRRTGGRKGFLDQVFERHGVSLREAASLQWRTIPQAA